jgi:hypothetical protein
VTGLERTMRALSGAVVTPSACGATFVPSEALPNAAPEDAPAPALARAYTDARLDFAFVPSWEPWASELADSLRGAGIAVLWVSPGVFTTALSSVGYSSGLRAIGREPATLDGALDEAEVLMVRAVAEGVAARADAIVVADDLAGARGPLASPEYFAEHVLQRLARAVAAARGAGMPALLHSDGEMATLLGDVARTGFTGVHIAGVGEESFARLFGVARTAGLVVMGGLGSQVLSQGLAGGVRTGARLAQLARSGPLLVADDGGITTKKEYSALIGAFSAARGRT